MRTTQIRQQLHDYIDNAENKKLKAIYTLLEGNIIESQVGEYLSQDVDKVKLTEDQILMLQLSDKDVEEGKLISQEHLDKNDIGWLKGK